MSSIHGRDAELAALDSAFADIGPRRHVLAVIRGRQGIGKSALLTAFHRRAPDALVLTAAFGDTAPPWDEFGVTALLAMAHQHFAEFTEPRVALSVETVRGLARPRTYQTPQGRSRLQAELTRLFGRLSQRRKVVLLADDVDALPSVALAALCAPRSLVVATCTEDRGVGELADHVVELGPLPADCVGSLLAKATGAAFDESTLRRLLTALGPLSRHPATLLSTVDDLAREGSLAVVHGRTCMADDTVVRVPAEHPAVAMLRSSVGHRLVSGTFGLDDLPQLVTTLVGTLAEHGRAVDELVRLKVLDCRPDGRLTCPSPALAARVLAETYGVTTVAPVSSLHRQVVRGCRTGDWSAVLAAARRLELAGPRAAAMLSAARLLAAEVCAEQGDDRQAMAWLAADDGHLPVLRAWVESGLRMRLGDLGAAFDLGWPAYLDAQDNEPGRQRLLMRLMVIAVLDGDHERAVMVLDEIEDQLTDSALLLFARAAVRHDLDGLRRAADLIRRRGHRPELLTICMVAGGLAAEPRSWLNEAHELATSLGARPLRARARDLMRLRGVSTPRTTADRTTTLSGTELQIGTLIRRGRTNRQIAVALRMSEKTVEYHLSRVFTKTGARTRVGVAAAMVKGRLEAISA